MPGDILQAEDRVHRVGQSASSVTIQFLLVKGSVDDIMWDVLQSKLDNVGQLLDGARDKLQVGAGQREEEPGHQEVTVMAVAAAQLVVQVKAQQGQLVMVGQTLLAVVAVELVAATAPLVELQQAEAAVPLSSCCPSAC